MTSQRRGPRLTIVIPTFERPDYLLECLATIEAQTWTDYRLVILDNASTTSYAAALKCFAHLPLVYVRNDANIGAAQNIAKAFRDYRQCEFLMVFHDDDLMHPRMLQWQTAILTQQPDVQFVASAYEPFVDGTDPPGWPAEGPTVEVCQDAAALARALLRGPEVCFGSAMYRSTAIGTVGMDFERFNMYCDRPFLLDIAKGGPCALVREPLVLYRLHPAQDSRSDVLTTSNLLELMKAYREVLHVEGEADRQLLLRSSSKFLAGSFRLLSDTNRPSLWAFLRAGLSERLLRLRDLSASDWAALLRGAGHGWLPDAAAAVRHSLNQRSRRGRTESRSRRGKPP